MLLAGAASIGALTAASEARAQSTCADPVIGCTTTTTSRETSFVIDPETLTTVNVTNYSTQILGRLNGGAPLYDQTFGVPFADPAAQAGVVAARAAITTGGGPGVVIGAPVLTGSSGNTSSSSVTIYSLAGTRDVVNPGVLTMGPGTVYIGDRDIGCTFTGSTAPSTIRPTKSCPPGDRGTPFVLGFNDTNVNVNIDTILTFNQDTTTTNTTTVFEQWTLVGYVQSVGVVHTAVQSGAFDSASRFLRRMGDEAGAGSDQRRSRGWAEVYGDTVRADDDGAAPGDRRDVYGFAGGLNAPLSRNIVLGFALDQGRTDIDLDSGFAETGAIDLSEIGVNAGVHAGAWFANLAGAYGFGDAETTHAVAGASNADYDLRTWGLLGETGYRFDLGGLRVIPSIGIDYVNLRTDSFTETGALALAAPSHDADRTRAWLGLDVGHAWPMASGGAFDLSGYARAIQVLSGAERLLPAAFAIAPDTPMTITGAREARTGADLGAQASYSFNDRVSLFVGYDARLRDGFDAHQGRVGFKLSW